MVVVTVIIMSLIVCVMIVMCLTEALFSMENKEVHPEGIERRDEHTGDHAEVGIASARDMRKVHRLDDRVLGVEARQEREPDQSQRSEQGRNPGNRHVLPEAAHVAHVLIMMHADNHGAGAQEQQRFEEGMRHQMEHRSRVGRHAECDRHVAEL